MASTIAFALGAFLYKSSYMGMVALTMALWNPSEG